MQLYIYCFALIVIGVIGLLDRFFWGNWVLGKNVIDDVNYYILPIFSSLSLIGGIIWLVYLCVQ